MRTTTAALTQALGTVQGARVVLEVGPRSPWLSRMVAELGHDVIVGNPRRVALIARSQCKTDRSDAEPLARLGRFDPELLAPIRHRGAETQADLQMLRSQDALLRTRTALINHVRGAVKAWGTALTFHRAVADHVPEKLRPALLPLLSQIEHLTRAGAGVAGAGQGAGPVHHALQHRVQVQGLGDAEARFAHVGEVVFPLRAFVLRVLGVVQGSPRGGVD